MNYITFLVIAVVVFLIVRRIRSASVPPPRIHLAPIVVSGKHARNLKRYARDLESRGFASLGTYRVDPMRGVVLTAFANPRESLCAVVYTHFIAGTFIDVVSKNDAGHSFTVTTAPAGKELDQPREHEKLFDPGMTVERMIETALQRRAPAPYVSWTTESFSRKFEEAYAQEMDWRAGRGGVTADEVRRTAGTMSGTFSEKDVQEATRRLHGKYADSRRDLR